MRLAAAILGTAALAGAVPATAAAPAPRVKALVLGPKGVRMAGPVAVSARLTRVPVGGHTCAVPRGTALAALAGVRRAGGPAFRVTDDGDCGALYVRKIGAHAARGPEGWVYKVGNRAGTTGADDPSGPFGTGRRIPSGAKVLWFWCRIGPRGCQRTLAARPSARAMAPGARLTVSVRSYDDFGRGRAVRGAKVVLGSSSALTNASGTAMLTAPARRRGYRVRATKTGLVPAYPEYVEVR